MDESPREAIRRKKDSSMRIAIDLVKEGRASACVSAGNTGALTAMAHFVLKTVAGVERAAIMSAIPAAHGAHPHARSRREHQGDAASSCAQFAIMGSIVARDVYGIASAARRPAQHRRRRHQGPRDSCRTRTRCSAPAALNYIGFVEGNDIFVGRRRRRRHRWLHRQRRAQDDGRRSPSSSSSSMRTEFSRDSAQQAGRAAGAAGAEARRRRPRSAPLQRRLHGGPDRYRGKKPRRRGQRRIRARDRHWRRIAARRGLTAHIAQALQTDRGA